MTEFLAARVPFWPSELRKWVCFRITPEKKQANTVSSDSLLDSQQNGLVLKCSVFYPGKIKVDNLCFLKTHVSHTGMRLSVLLSCPLAVFKLVTEGKRGIYSLTVFRGGGGFVSLLESFQLQVGNRFHTVSSSSNLAAGSWRLVLLSAGLLDATCLASQPSLLSFPSSTPPSFLVDYLVRAAMAAHSNSLHSKVQTQLAVAEPAGLLKHEAQVVSIKL